MQHVDPDKLQALNQSLADAISAHSHAPDENSKQISLFRMNFIKKFTDDVWYLNDHSGQNDFHVRYATFILRNMVEQVIEFLYISKNVKLIDEYLGSEISKKHSAIDSNSTTVEALKIYGEKRFATRRERIAQMAEDINERYATKKDCLTLYDVFTVLSDRTHNSYFSSLLDDFAKEFSDDHYIGLTVEQVRYLNVLIIVVLMTFSDFNQGDSL